jgi:hypothetical protein
MVLKILLTLFEKEGGIALAMTGDLRETREMLKIKSELATRKSSDLAFARPPPFSKEAQTTPTRKQS